MVDPSKLLTAIPVGLRDPLLESYRQIVRNYAERRWEPAELNGGKFCEAAYSIIAGYIDGSSPTKPSKPRDMVAACRALEVKAPSSSRVGDRSVRILIPRMLLPLYEIRNNRGVGHLGGDVDPNLLDATSVLHMAGWIMAEVIRVFHGVTVSEAQNMVDALVERTHPLIWQVENIKRVLQPDMRKEDQTLVLLYSEAGWVEETKLVEWVEYSTLTMFRRRILQPLHDDRMVEYDSRQQRVCITPRGIRTVEDKLLPSIPSR